MPDLPTTILLTWRKSLLCHVDLEGNVWVMDHEPGYILREKIKKLEETVKELRAENKVVITGDCESLIVISNDTEGRK